MERMLIALCAGVVAFKHCINKFLQTGAGFIALKIPLVGVGLTAVEQVPPPVLADHGLEDQAVALHFRTDFEYAAYEYILFPARIAHADMGLAGDQQRIPRIVAVNLKGKR